MHSPTYCVRGAGHRRPAHHTIRTLAALGGVALLAGCTSTSQAGPPPTSSTAPVITPAGATSAAPAAVPTTVADGSGAGPVISSLGAVPIPSAPTADPVPTATPAHPQLLAIGAPVKAALPDGTTALVVASGPDQLGTAPGGPPPRSTIGLITVTAQVDHGQLALAAADFSSRDATGRTIALTANGPSPSTAAAGHTATLKVQGRFGSGAAQITWTQHRAILALWDFNIELD